MGSVLSCRVCGKTQWAPILSFGQTPLADRFVRPGEERDEPLFELAFQHCRGCGWVSFTETVDPEMLDKPCIFISSDSHTISSHRAHKKEDAFLRGAGDLSCPFRSPA